MWHKSRAFWTSVLASSVVFGDIQVVNLNLDTIQATYGVGLAQIQLIAAMGFLPIAAGVLLAGDLVDRFGRRVMLQAGLLLYIVASLHWWFDFPFLVRLGFRFVQGAGLTMIIPSSQALLAAHFTGMNRSLALSRWVVFTTALSVVIPPSAGYLIDKGLWRESLIWGTLLASLALFASKGLRPQPRPEPRAFDLISVLFLLFGLGSVVIWSLGSEEIGLPNQTRQGLLLAGILLLVGLVARSLSRPNPLLPLDLWKSPTIRTVNGISFLTFGLIAAIQVILPLTLIQAYGWSARSAALMSVPYYLLITLLAPSARAIYAKSAKLALTIGPLIAGLGVLGLSVFRFDEPLGVASWIVVGLGMAIPSTCCTSAILDASPAERMGASAGLNSTSARLGTLLSVALLGGIYSSFAVIDRIEGFQKVALVASVGLLISSFLASRGVRPRPGQTFGVQ